MGLQGCTGYGGRRLLNHTPQPPPSPAEHLPSASTQLGIREGFTDVSHPRFLFFTETERPQFSTLVPPLLYML